MPPAILRAILLTGIASVAFTQASDSTPKFEFADVHAGARATNTSMRVANLPNLRAGRYELRNATMVDLVSIAYGFDPDKVLGGPNWLEMDRFDVIAKAPEDATQDSAKVMLQSLLQDRFKLVSHKDTKPLPTYALMAGKKPLLKEAAGTEETGCKPQSSGISGEGTIHMMTSGPDGKTSSFTLAPGGVIQYACRNMTMEQFAAGLRGMFGASLGPNAVLDQTGIKGAWNFDVKWSMALFGGPMMQSGDRISIFDAMEKQLGLKLEEKQIPTPVIVVDSVNKVPSPNPPGTAEALPVVPPPTEFEVASMKPTPADARMSMGFRFQTGGRLTSEGMPLRFLVARAFNTNNNNQIVGLPAWVDTERYDVIAKAPSVNGAPPPADMASVAPMMLSLLVDRCKMTYHTEDRPLAAYTLVAGKPKMKKADPNSRTFCKTPTAPPGSASGTRLLVCQNVTMDQFADRLQNMTSDLAWPVQNSTGIEGGWDFTVSFTQSPMMAMRVGGPVGDAGAAGGAAPTAADPTGGLTLFEAIEKQLGLKLESQKRPLPVIVIDHMERPTEN